MIDLNHLDKYKENNRIEAKKALGGLPKSIWETYSSFANTLGGIILLGVEEYRDKSFHTVDLPDPEGLVEEFWGLVNTPSKASINILRKEDIRIETVNGDHIIVIEVPRAHRSQKPVYVDGSVTAGTYRRDGEGDYHCTQEEIYAMHRDATRMTQDRAILKDCGLLALSEKTLKECQELGIDRDKLLDLGALAYEGDEIHVSVAGLLMFGKGSEIAKKFPLFLLEYREERNGECVEKHAFAKEEEDMNVFSFFQHVRNKLLSFGLDGEEALEDALLNCLVNADYRMGGGIEVVKREDAILISNPGDFRVNVDDALKGGLSDPRNSLMMEIFRMAGYGKGEGNGIPRILSSWQEAGNAMPRISQSFHPARILLSLPIGKAGEEDLAKAFCDKTEEVDAIIGYLTYHVEATARELTENTGMDIESVRRILKGLVKRNIVQEQGERRNRTYRLMA